MTTLTKERPILFRPELVRAIIEGRKRQTRRIIRWKPRVAGLNLHFSGLTAGHYCTDAPSSGWVLRSRDGRGTWNDRTFPIHCPYGQPGDFLWVREAFALRLDIKEDDDGHSRARRYVRYRADGGDLRDEFHVYGRWKPSIHMPRWASRLTIQVTNVRVELLKDITDGDVAAEGVTWNATGGPLTSRTRSFATDAFSHGWDKINAKRGFGWDVNPWVWVVEFCTVP